jgi:dihydroflavonol-4-reductase
MRRYLITGGLGFLGQYIVRAIHEHDLQCEVRVLVRTPRRTYLPIRTLERVSFVVGDLSKPDSLTSALNGVQTVIHNAALVSFKPADRQTIYRCNIAGTQNLLQAAASQGCNNFVFISSISAVGLETQPADETCLPDLAEKQAHDPYGYSKLIGEREVRGYSAQMRVVILNPSVVIGPGSERIRRLSHWLRLVPFVPMITTVNSFVDVRDVARAVVLALDAGRSGERYIVTGWDVDMPAFSRAALSALGRRAPVVPLPAGLVRLGDGLVKVLDIMHLNPGIRRLSAMNVDKAYSTAKIRAELGWAPAFTLEQSLADTFAGESTFQALTIT